MKFFVVGTNHKYSSIKLRERLAFSKLRRMDALFLLKERGVLSSAAILSTCNRVEIYASSHNELQGINEILNFLLGYKEMNKELLFSSLYILTGEDALKHLFKVCAGLDSLILGELQIFGQVRASFHEAENMRFTDELLTNIFQTAMFNAKKIYAETNISEGKVSVGSVAVDFIKQKLGSVTGKNVLIIGVGKVTELVLKYLNDEKPSVIFVSNRTFDKARELAARIGARVIRFDGLKGALKKADVVITATTSSHFILKKEMLAEIVRPLLIVDLAMPRDVDPNVKGMGRIELYTLEDLDDVIKKNKDRKEKEAKKAIKIIDNEVKDIWQKFSELEQEQALLL